MSITATELKQNLGKYLLLSGKEDIYITKNGKIIAKLTNPHQDKVSTAQSLFGIHRMLILIFPKKKGWRLNNENSCGY